jgi:hypothetical protein
MPFGRLYMNRPLTLTPIARRLISPAMKSVVVTIAVAKRRRRRTAARARAQKRA